MQLEELELSIQQSARELAENLLWDKAAGFEQNEEIPLDTYSSLGGKGLMQVATPEAFGGSDAGTIAYSLAMMEVSRACAATAVTMAVTNMVGEVIAEFGTDAQKSEYCSKLAKGGLGAFALSEVGAGSDPGGMRTTAVQDDDDWIINGTKQWISHGDQSAVMVVWARTDGDGPRGLSCFLVDGDAEGVSVETLEDKMGLCGSHTASLVFENVRVPSSAMLSGRAKGFPIAMMALDGGRIGIGSQASGIATRAYEEAVNALKERDIDQDEQFALADMKMRLEAMKELTLRAAWLKKTKQPFSHAASIAKAFSSENAWWICNKAVEVIGEDALRFDHPANRMLRASRVTMIYEGTSEVQRIVISRGALR